ncbi:MAG: hypothetical protein ACFFB3_18080, partial [Candidatus Hodarchaeota archaeon]
CIIEIDKESEVLQRVILPREETLEIISPVEEVPAQEEELESEEAELEMEIVINAEDSAKESLADEIVSEIPPIPPQSTASSSPIETTGII